MGIFVAGRLKRVGDGDYEGNKYYFAEVHEPVTDALGDVVHTFLTRVSLDEDQYKQLRKVEGDEVNMRCTQKPGNNKLAFSSLVKTLVLS